MVVVEIVGQNINLTRIPVKTIIEFVELQIEKLILLALGHKQWWKGGLDK